jgi:hypothetical protein
MKDFDFKKLMAICDEVKSKLVETNAFKAIQIAPVSSYRSLLEKAKNVAVAPKAFITLGSGDFSDDSLSREFTLAIIIFDSYKATSEQAADDLYPLAETALKPFMPVFDENGVLQPLQLGNTYYAPKSWSPIDTGDRSSAIAVEIKVTDVASYIEEN